MSKVTEILFNEVQRILNDIGANHPTIDEATEYLKRRIIEMIKSNNHNYLEECTSDLVILEAITSNYFNKVYNKTFN